MTSVRPSTGAPSSTSTAPPTGSHRRGADIRPATGCCADTSDSTPGTTCGSSLTTGSGRGPTSRHDALQRITVRTSALRSTTATALPVRRGLRRDGRHGRRSRSRGQPDRTTSGTSRVARGLGNADQADRRHTATGASERQSSSTRRGTVIDDARTTARDPADQVRHNVGSRRPHDGWVRGHLRPGGGRPGRLHHLRPCPRPPWQAGSRVGSHYDAASGEQRGGGLDRFCGRRPGRVARTATARCHGNGATVALLGHRQSSELFTDMLSALQTGSSAVEWTATCRPGRSRAAGRGRRHATATATGSAVALPRVPRQRRQAHRLGALGKPTVTTAANRASRSVPR